MAHYVNSPADEGRNSPDKRGNSHSGWSKVLSVVGVSFGLLCIVQSALNVSLRLQGFGFCNKSDLIDSANVTLMSAADIGALRREKDQLTKENRELQASNDCLTRDNEMLHEQLRQQEDCIAALATEKERLMMRLSEIESRLHSCPPGWRPYMSSCYQLSTGRNTWTNAQEDCVAKGAHLVIINDAGEEDFLHTLGSSDMWIGLKGRLRTWRWVDMSQMTDVNRIQPQQGGRHVYCVYSEPSPFGSATWVGASCREQHRWVCEKEPN